MRFWPQESVMSRSDSKDLAKELSALIDDHLKAHEVPDPKDPSLADRVLDEDGSDTVSSADANKPVEVQTPVQQKPVIAADDLESSWAPPLTTTG